jgi:glycosyltransferase involved in cell wall biosynthesis
MKIAYVGPFSFPSNNANSIRVLGVANALSSEGIDIYICSQDTNDFTTPMFDLHDKVEVVPLDEAPNPTLPRWRRLIKIAKMGGNTVSWLKHNSDNVDAVIVYGTPFFYLLRILPLCKKLKIPIILDVVEWYDYSHLPGGKYGLQSLLYKYSMEVLSNKANGIIAISRYLENHFRSFDLPTIRVPPIFKKLDVRPIQFRKQDNKYHICYSGTLGLKDQIIIFLKALFEIPDVEDKVKLHLIGITGDEFTALCKELNLDSKKQVIDSVIMVYGRIENKLAKNIISSSDFTVLFREKTRFTMAGFPSKVGESLSLGTPVFCNLTSNLDEYLFDQKNAIVVQSNSYDDIYNSIKRLLVLSDETIESMKEHTLGKGSQSFDYMSYAQKIRLFIEGLHV